MKLLKDILYKVRIEQVEGSTNTAVERIIFDSRQVRPFTLFVAVRGTQADGHAFMDKAVEAGASAVVCEEFPPALKEGVTYVLVADAAQRLAESFFALNIVISFMGGIGPGRPMFNDWRSFR